MKKILIVTYYWLPYSETGTYRVSRIVKYLKRMGWDPIILTPNKSATRHKYKNHEEVFRNLKVYHTKIFEPSFFFKSNVNTSKNMANASFFLSGDLTLKQRIIRWIRVNLFIPDAKMYWKGFAVRKGKYVIKKEKPDIIFSTAPPPTTHLVARKLAKWSQLPWFADFRDPWTHIFYYENLRVNPVSRWINNALERRVLKDADKVITVSDHFFPNIDLGKKNVLIENGFDPDDVEGLNEETKTRNEKFTIRYIGTLKTNQFFKNFFEILKEIGTRAEYKGTIKFETAGYIDSSIKEYMENELKGIDVHIQGYIDHPEALKQMAQADLLILAIGRGQKSKNVISTKIFEYLMVGRPILAFGHLDGSAHKVLCETKGGKMFDYDAYDQVRQFFLEKYHHWKENQFFHSPDENKIKQYSFEVLTQKLSSLMESCLSKKMKE